MSEIGQDVESEDTDIKDFLIQTLKSDGTLKQIQDQLTAAVYSAFYQQNPKPVDREPSSVHSFMTSKNGIEVISLVVDLLHSLKLDNTLNVLTHEANLNNYQLSRREELASHFKIDDKSKSQPLIMYALLSDNAVNEIHPLSKAVVLETDDQEKKCYKSSTLKTNKQFEIKTEFEHPDAPTFHSTEFKQRENNSSAGVKPMTKPSSHSKGTIDWRVQSSIENTSELAHEDSKDCIDSYTSENSRADLQYDLSCDERINKTGHAAAAVDDETTSESSRDHLTVNFPSDGDLVDSVSRATVSSGGGGAGAGWGSHKDVFRAVPGRAENGAKPSDCGENGNSSDIDSEINNDITVNSSRPGEYDYVEAVRRLP